MPKSRTGISFGFQHDLEDLVEDLRSITRQAGKDMHRTVVTGIAAGNRLAKESAERTAGDHGKLYPKAFTTEMGKRFALYGTVLYHGEYGPRIDMPQGGMSFEFGSRNQPPHLDLAKSADIIGGSFAQEVRGLPDKWFWDKT